MIRSFSLFVLIFGLCVVMSCKDGSTTEEVVPVNPIFGHWKVINPNVEAHLLVRPDSTFHVDILAQEGIEAEGVATVESDSRITFVNTGGTDTVASNPVPGTYDFQITSDTLRFTVVSDTLSRRVGLLSAPWVPN
jgi:hypothetical protein